MKISLKQYLLAAAVLLVMAVVACGDSTVKFEKGKLVSGTVTSSDSKLEGWKAKPYSIVIFEDVEYFVRLTSPEGASLGLWNPLAEEYIVEVNSETTTRTVAYKFEVGDVRKLYVRSPESDVPASFTFMLWLPSSVKSLKRAK